MATQDTFTRSANESSKRGRLVLEKFVNDQRDSTELKTRKTRCYLTGVLGLPGNFRGERSFGSKENFSLTFSSTDGATYVKPWG